MCLRILRFSAALPQNDDLGCLPESMRGSQNDKRGLVNEHYRFVFRFIAGPQFHHILTATTARKTANPRRSATGDSPCAYRAPK